MWLVLAFTVLLIILSDSGAYSLLSRLKGAIKRTANTNLLRKITKLGLKPELSYTGLGFISKRTTKESAPAKSALLSRLTSWLMKRAIHAHTRDARGLRINIDAGSSISVAQGRLGTIEIEFEQLSSREMQVSGGGKITISNFQIDLKKLLFHNLQFVQKPYTVHCDLRLTQDDILSSNFVKSVTQKLANTVLEQALGSADVLNISVSKVYIDDGRVVISGQAAYPVTESLSSTTTCSPNLRGSPYESERTEEPPVLFEIAASLAMRPASDQIVLLQDLSIKLEPDYLLLRSALPRSIELDLGEGCHVQRLDVSNNMLHFAGSSQIFPHQPLRTATNSSNVSVNPAAVSVVPLTVTEYVSANLLSLWWASWTTAFYQFDLAKVLSSNICLNGGLISSLFRRK